MNQLHLIYRAMWGFLLGASIASSASFAATPLSDRALRQQTEANPAITNVVEVLDCPRDMREAECTRLQYERYANQTNRSYNEFLKTETTNPLRNRVIKQPLLTQPLENRNAPAQTQPTLNDLINQQVLPGRTPSAGTGIQP